MGGVLRAGAEVHEEGFVGRDLLGVGDEADGLVDQVFGEVVALFGCLLRLDGMVVVDQFRIVLVGVAAEEAVVALEAASQWPAIVGAGCRDLIGGRQVPLAEGIGVVAVLQQHLGEHAVLEGDVSVSAGIAGRSLGDAGHGVRVVVAAGHDAGTGGRTERRGVHVVKEQAVRLASWSMFGVSMGLP